MSPGQSFGQCYAGTGKLCPDCMLASERCRECDVGAPGVDGGHDRCFLVRAAVDGDGLADAEALRAGDGDEGRTGAG